MEHIDAYCERLSPAFWAEPVNAVTNAAFLIAALIMWRRSRGEPLAQALCIVLGLIGIGSFLFHTFATPWAGAADVLPILVYILLYIFTINRGALGWPLLHALLGMLAFVPYAAAAGWVFARLPFFEVSSFYWPVPLLIFAYAAVIRGQLGRDMAIGAAILCLSLAARSLDMALCPVWALGTHFLWHILNGIMLGWMIHAYLTHRRLAVTAPQR